MNGNRFQFISLLLVFFQVCVNASVNISSLLLNSVGNRYSGIKSENVYFELPDISIDIRRSNHLTRLEAYRISLNDAILREGNPHKYTQLQWVSIGDPTLIESTVDKNIYKLFHFTRDGFYVLVDMLTPEHVQELKAAVKHKYRIEVDSSQFVNLIPSRFECSMKLVNINGEDFLIKGSVTNPNKIPMTLVFDAKTTTKERIEFEKIVAEDGNNLDISINCEASTSAKSSQTNTFKISAEQWNRLNIVEKIFGPVEEKFVTRDQLASLSSEVYSKLNIIEEYEVPQSQFDDNFINTMINEAVGFSFRPVLIEEAIRMLSKYSLDIQGDLKADEITRDLGKILKIDKRDSKEHIIYDTDFYEHLRKSSSSSSEASAKGSFGLLKVSASAKHAQSKASDWQTSQKTLDDQLHELNTLETNDIQWERVGNMIKPKSLNVARFNKGSFTKTLELSRIKIIKYNADFIKRFSLKTLKVYRKPAGPKQESGAKRYLQNHWSFNNVNDVVSGSNLFNGVNTWFTTDRFGNTNSAMHFEGGYYQAPPGIYFKSEYAITSWVRPTNSDQFWARVLDFGNKEQKDIVGFSISYEHSLIPNFGFHVIQNTENALFGTFGRQLQLNEWSHIAVVVRKSSWSTYINGLLVNEGSNTALPQSVIRFDNFIGKSNFPADSNLFGDLDDVKIFNGPLSDDEIFEVYNSRS